MTPCGHCDNCTRPPETVDLRDVTEEAWQILTIVEAVQRQRGRVTLNKLADMARGPGKAEFGVASRGRKGKGKATTAALDVGTADIKLVELHKDVSRRSYWCIRCLWPSFYFILLTDSTRSGCACNCFWTVI